MSNTMKLAALPAAAGLLIGGALMILPANAATATGADTECGVPTASVLDSILGGGAQSSHTATSTTKTTETSTNTTGGSTSSSSSSSTATAGDGSGTDSSLVSVADGQTTTSFLNGLFGDSLLGLDLNGGLVNLDKGLVNVGDVSTQPILSGNNTPVDVPVNLPVDLPVNLPIISGNDTKADVPAQAPVANNTDLGVVVKDTVTGTLDAVTGQNGLLGGLLNR